MANKAVPPADVDAMVALYEQGLKVAQIAARSGWAGHTVRAQLRKRGVLAPRAARRLWTSAEDEVLMDLAASGLGATAISRRMGWSTPQIYKYARRAGIPMTKAERLEGERPDSVIESESDKEDWDIILNYPA